ncbi:selenocysteine-specific translation elongation factor [Desulfobulbus alkaliphilus]|uniref:selenocysteine-specific translation elongation factor n=1 Tax=Desulfobulbus alkaliphilus TaxID=869814 RepID=UPI0019651DDA|nr:selenocysteine-specific translation elongation factor [Desulfobulbus alkaliphilus]MBM9537635.1 selenocysteine-specific translation elongation factor [Desulfobulbus alkaliphilus]
MREIILGTAGHVDHGKTSLIRALTGIDTDRLKEEKERGITIELGFAHLDLPCGHRLGIVDVPGHEKFIRNMVAGAAGMDLVAFIIAADEGIMPQTIEHFDICRLLGVRDGLVILTKKDLVDQEWLDMVEEEVREFFRDSFLAAAPIVAVDSLSGEGLDTIIQFLDDKVAAMPFHEEFGPFRLAVDRVFSMKGFGTVITGTSLSGRVTVGEELMFYPSGLTARIRGIQVHGQDVQLVEAGHRTAINLQGIEKDEISRGDMAATPGSLIASTLLDTECRHLPSTRKDLKNRTLVRVHLGTREIVGRVILLETDALPPGASGPVQLILQEPAAVWPGDRYVIRSYSPITTIGGGTILGNAPKKRRRTLEKDRLRNRTLMATYASDNIEEKAILLIKESGAPGLTAEQLAVRTGIFGKRLKKILQLPISTGSVLVIDSESQRMIAGSTADSITRKITDFLTRFHQDNPLKATLAKEELRSRLRPVLDHKLLQALLTALVKKGVIEQIGAEIKLAGHTVTLQVNEQEMEQKIGALYQQAGLTPPNLKEVLATFTEFTEKQIRQVIDLLIAKGMVIKVNESLCFHAPAIEQLQQELITYIRREGEIDAPRFKELTGLTRKFSIPLLEYFDKIKLTIRIDDKRVLRRK